VSKIIIMGGRGNGMVVASTIERMESNQWEILGFLNDEKEIGSLISKYPILGKIDDAKKFDADDVYFYFGVFSLARKWNNVERIKKIGLPTEKYAIIIDPTAVISPFTEIGHGCYIGPYAIIGPDTKIGNFVQIFGHGFLGHNSTLGDYAFVSNNAAIGGAVTVETGAYIGINSCIREFITIGEWSVVGMGSVIIRDVPPKTTVAGNPAKPIKSIQER